MRLGTLPHQAYKTTCFHNLCLKYYYRFIISITLLLVLLLLIKQFSGRPKSAWALRIILTPPQHTPLFVRVTPTHFVFIILYLNLNHLQSLSICCENHKPHPLLFSFHILFHLEIHHNFKRKDDQDLWSFLTSNKHPCNTPATI